VLAEISPELRAASLFCRKFVVAVWKSMFCCPVLRCAFLVPDSKPP
jgi:hypothetical protein